MPRKRKATRLAANLRYLRLQNVHTQQTIADLLDCTRFAVCKYESGDRSPSVAQLRKLAHWYSTTVDSLLNDDLSGVFTNKGESNA